LVVVVAALEWAAPTERASSGFRKPENPTYGTPIPDYLVSPSLATK